MINSSDGAQKSTNDYLEHVRQQIGYGHSDKAETRTAKKALDKDDFVKLMSVQLKYQDPTSPMKNEEMAAQLAQFSGLEQMQNVNRNLEKMGGANELRDSMMAASLIGKRIETDGAKFKLGEDRKASMNFEVPDDIGKGKVSIVDAKGNVVRDLVLENMDKGKQSIKWDGRNEKGSNAELGEYTFRVTAYDKAGKQMEAKTNTTGIVTGVEFDKGKPILLVGDERVYMEVVSRIDNLPEGTVTKSASDTKAKDPRAAVLGADAAASGAKPAAKAAHPGMPGLDNAIASMQKTLSAGASPAVSASAPAEKNESAGLWPSQMSGAGGNRKIEPTQERVADRPMVIDDAEPNNAANQSAGGNPESQGKIDSVAGR